jgi:hypothetical protein
MMAMSRWNQHRPLTRPRGAHYEVAGIVTGDDTPQLAAPVAEPVPAPAPAQPAPAPAPAPAKRKSILDDTGPDIDISKMTR